jgi:hypothetical protein
MGKDKWDALIKDIRVPEPGLEGECGCKNMCVLIKRLEETADIKTLKDILFRVRHGMTPEQIGGLDGFEECGGNIDAYLTYRRKENETEFLNHHANGTEFWGDVITDKALDYLLNTEGVTAPVRKGSELHITRYPYDMTAYFNETDERKKRFHYCHCLFARSSILNEGATVSKSMCYCSLGLVKAQWEAALGMELDGEIVQSVLGGDDICKFIIYLPDEILEKHT